MSFVCGCDESCGIQTKVCVVWLKTLITLCGILRFHTFHTLKSILLFVLPHHVLTNEWNYTLKTTSSNLILRIVIISCNNIEYRVLLESLLESCVCVCVCGCVL